jgi:SAM-dependent methyltransferase
VANSAYVPGRLPLPPLELLQRVGRIDEPDVAGVYEAIGRHSRARLERLLPADWSWEGKHVLDFGCGAGRTLRHFLAEAEHAEFYGCDIDGPSIDWLTENFSPPLHVFQSGELPSLPQPDGFFDLIYAFSVFTHLADRWAGWLLELHRVLEPEGLLLATFLSEPHWETYEHGAWAEDRAGMNVIKKWNPWDTGGPIVFHSEWWIREHWGRVFEIVYLETRDPDDPEGQGAALLRSRPERLQQADVERPGDDPRELEALRTNVEQLHREAGELFEQLSEVTASQGELTAKLEPLECELGRLQTELAGISKSRSWQLTAPLRATAALFRRRQG